MKSSLAKRIRLINVTTMLVWLWAIACRCGMAAVQPDKSPVAVPAEMRQQEQWFKQYLSDPKPPVPFSFTDLDKTMQVIMSGRDLMHQGLRVKIKDKPGAAIIIYRDLAGRGRRVP